MLYEYTGNLHIHTTYSDGSGNIEDVVMAAKKAGIDFVGITDHNTLKGYKEGKEGWYDDVLVLIGAELNTRYNHYLAFDVNEDIRDHTSNPQQTIDEVKKQGGFGFIAHPFEKGSRLVFEGKAFTWNAWNVKGYTGISIWNYCSRWRDAVTSIVKGFYCYYINRTHQIGPDDETLRKWDELTQTRKVVGIGCSDAHAHRVRYGFLKLTIFPYEYLFKTVNTHVLLSKPLTKDFHADRRMIYDALKHGHCFIGFDLYWNSRGFRYWAEKGRTRFLMGDGMDLSADIVLKVEVPRMGIIRLIHNGKLILTKKERFITVPVKHKGSYRVEVYSKNFLGSPLPWIYSNPIYIY